MWNAFVIVFPFKIHSRSANPDLRVIVVLGLCCIVRNRAAESCVMPSLLNRCVRAQIPQFDKKTKGRNRKYRSFASFLFLKLFEGWNNEEHRSMNEQKASWMSAEKLSFSTFPSEPGRWTCPIFIHAAFYSAKQKERKMGWYREIVEEVIYYFLSFVHWPSLITIHCAGGGTEMEPYGQKNDQFTHSIISLSTRDIAIFSFRL